MAKLTLLVLVVMVRGVIASEALVNRHLFTRWYAVATGDSPTLGWHRQPLMWVLGVLEGAEAQIGFLALRVLPHSPERELFRVRCPKCLHLDWAANHDCE
jgi:hypothetical protein